MCAGRDQKEKKKKKKETRRVRTRVLRAHAPVGDQNVIAKIKETVAGGAERRRHAGGYMCVCIYVYVYVRVLQRGDSERETILRALLGRKPFWGPVLLINELPECVLYVSVCIYIYVCTFLRFVSENNRESLSEYQIGISSLASDNRLIVSLNNACIYTGCDTVYRIKSLSRRPVYPFLCLI